MASLFGSALVDTSDHHQILRESVGKIVGSFGRSYFQGVVKRKEKPDALWAALGEAGFLGVFIAEKYGGGGSGLADYNVVVEETAAQGCPMLSLVIGSICAPIIEQHGSEAMKQKCVEIMTTKKTIMWEVNVWYLLHLEGSVTFDVYKCDHNDSLVENY